MWQLQDRKAPLNRRQRMRARPAFRRPPRDGRHWPSVSRSSKRSWLRSGSKSHHCAAGNLPTDGGASQGRFGEQVTFENGAGTSADIDFSFDGWILGPVRGPNMNSTLQILVDGYIAVFDPSAGVTASSAPRGTAVKSSLTCAPGQFPVRVG